MIRTKIATACINLLAAMVLGSATVDAGDLTPVSTQVSAVKALASWHDAVPADPANPQIAAALTGHYSLDSGDKIRIRVYQRDDLSGEFTVGTDGTISLPLLGTFKVTGKDEDQVRRDVSDAARKIMDRSVDVVAEITLRRPVYIVGYVEHPGVYPFALGMTVVHALSMAGGTYRPAMVSSQVAELTKELGSLEQNADTLKRDIVRLARLQAEKNGKPFTDMPLGLTDITGESEARDLVATEKQQQVNEQEARLQKQDASKRARQLAEDELVQLKLKIAQIENQIKLNAAQKQGLERLAAQGFSRKIQIATVESNDATLILSKLEALANISRATRTVEDMKSQMAAEEISQKRAMDTEINSLTTQIGFMRSSIRNSRTVISGAAGQDSTRGGSDPESLLSYSVMRRSTKGYVYVTVDDVAPLLPGDVLRVTLTQPGSNQVRTTTK